MTKPKKTKPAKPRGTQAYEYDRRVRLTAQGWEDAQSLVVELGIPIGAAVSMAVRSMLTTIRSSSRLARLEAGGG